MEYVNQIPIESFFGMCSFCEVAVSVSWRAGLALVFPAFPGACRLHDVHKSPMETAVLINDEPDHAAWLRACVADVPDLSLIHEADSVETAQAMLQGWRGAAPALVLLDLRQGARSGLDLMASIRRAWSGTAVLVVSELSEPGQFWQAIHAGANGYLLKDGDSCTVAWAINAARSGLILVAAPMARFLLARLEGDAAAAGGAGAGADRPTSAAPQQVGPAAASGNKRLAPAGALTQREQAVLECLARGLTYNEVATELAIALSTVQSHVRRLYSKLHASGKMGAVEQGRAYGLLR